ncbi:hypothetical protein TNCV_2717961 [Trichonephila clavipes]|nr:hypothetical protein TNCV_2717961 [Trichonephila clavipes]
MFDSSSYDNPTPLAHADASRDVFPRGGTSHTLQNSVKRMIVSKPQVPRAANWSHRSLYPASNQRAASKLSAKPKKLKKFNTQMKHHSHASRIPLFNQSPSCHSAEWKTPLSPCPAS